MSAKLKAAEEIKKLGRSLKGFIAFAEELEQMGSLEQAAAELNQSFERSKKASLEAKKDLESVEAEIKAAKDFAKSTVESAKEEASALVLAAQAKAEGIVSKAMADADGVRAEFKEEKIVLQNELKVLREAIEKAKAELSQANNGLDEAKKQMALIKSKLA